MMATPKRFIEGILPLKRGRRKWYNHAMDTPTPMPTDEELKAKLTPEEYKVLREQGTEAPFTGAYVDNHDAGVYRCKVCGNVLFSSDTKFDSGTGWPSFTDPAVSQNVGVRTDKDGYRNE